jgi:undecaprenyl-diphosphatase
MTETKVIDSRSTPQEPMSSVLDPAPLVRTSGRHRLGRKIDLVSPSDLTIAVTPGQTVGTRKVGKRPPQSSRIGRARHPGDLVRVCCASILIVVTSLVAATHRVSRFEEDVFRLINRLPDVFRPALNAVMQGGALGAVPVVAIIALAGRRTRLARDMAIAGGAAWVSAKLLKSLVGRQRPFVALEAVFRHTTDGGLGFPSGHAAVAAALATAAAPYLGRHLRRTVWITAVVVGIARIYLGAHLPLDVIGGWSLGWLFGSLGHLAFGAPNNGPSNGQVASAVESIVGPVDGIRRLLTDARGSVPYVGTTADGHVFAKVITTQHRDADALYKLARLVMFRHLEDEAPFNSPQQVAEHEAYVTLMAGRAGVRVAHVRGSARFAHSSVLVLDFIDRAGGLDTLNADTDVTAVLTDAWRQISLLHDAHIAHRDLRLANLIIDGDGLVRIVDFGFAEETASERRMAMDVAEFLTATALQFGTDEAISTAMEGVGPAALASALPFIQPLALSASTRARLRHDRSAIRKLRDDVATRTGAEQPELEPLERIKPITIIMVVALGFGIHLLLPRIGELGATIRELGAAQWPWLAGALAASAVTYAFAATAVMGASPIPVPFGRTTVAELASSFANRFVPLGGTGVMVRYLQRHGLDRTAAVTSVATVDLGGFTVHVPLLLLAGVATGTSGIKGVHLPTGWHVLIISVGVLAILGIVLTTRLRSRIRRIATNSVHQLGGVVRDPRRAAQLWLGSLGITSMYIVSLACALAAFSAHAPLERVAFVYLVGTAVSAAAPTPGGLGAVEAALVAGLTATGVAAAPAIAGVLTYRLATFWIPTLPGWLAFRLLRARHEL